MSAFDQLPTIIDGPGDYLTRDGRRVTIREISGQGTFNAKGAIWKSFRGVLGPHGFDLWHVNGRKWPLQESPRDIIGKE